MSTRCTTHFRGYGDGSTVAIVYRHSDGYPEGAGADILSFFEQVKEQCEGTIAGTRFTDPSYLAAKYVVFLTGIFAKSAAYDYRTGETGEIKPLNFGSVGIMDQDPGDIEYRYVIDCDNIDADGFPVVTVEEAGSVTGTLGRLDDVLAQT